MVQSWIAPILAPRERGSLPGLVDLPEYQSSPSSSSGLSLYLASALVPIEGHSMSSPEGWTLL